MSVDGSKTFSKHDQTLTEKNKIPIILFTVELGVGGAERCLVNLACRLKQSRFEPTIISMASPPEQRRGLVDQLDEQNVATFFLDCNSKFDFFKAIRKLRSHINEIQPKILVSFLFHANVISSLAIKNFQSLKHVVGIRVAEPNRMRNRIERWATQKASSLVCVSESVSEHLKLNGFPASKIKVIGNGIDLSWIDQLEPLDQKELEALGIARPFVIAVGRLEPQKNFLSLVETSQELFLRLPNHDLVIVGDGSQREEIRKAIRRANDSGAVSKGEARKDPHSSPRKVGGQIIQLPWQERLIELIKASDGLILCSNYEGMPNVVLEAMACGKPVASWDTDGVAEILEKNPHSQIAKSGDFSALYTNLSQVLSDEQVRESAGSENRRLVEINHSLESSLGRYLGEFRTLISENFEN